MDAFDCIWFPWNLSASLLVFLTVFKFVPIEYLASYMILFDSKWLMIHPFAISVKASKTPPRLAGGVLVL